MSDKYCWKFIQQHCNNSNRILVHAS